MLPACLFESMLRLVRHVWRLDRLPVSDVDSFGDDLKWNLDMSDVRKMSVIYLLDRCLAAPPQASASSKDIGRECHGFPNAQPYFADMLPWNRVLQPPSLANLQQRLL